MMQVTRYVCSLANNFKAQYGNILRRKDSGDNILYKPPNEHKQLIVIDFEYANANVPGLEFANHFTEWCYNYHDATHPFLCDTSMYPGPQEQSNFFRAYVTHRPSFPPAPNTLSHRVSTASLTSLASSLPPTPSMHPSAPAIGMVSSFTLEARGPPSATSSHGGGVVLRDLAEKEEMQEEAVRREIERLRWETRAWRGLNSAQWIMWGIVQATIPGLPDFAHLKSPYLRAKEKNEPEEDLDKTPTVKAELESSDGSQREAAGGREVSTKDEQVDEEDEDSFDYLSYAYSRAQFFWGDVIGLGIMDRDELPDDVRERAVVLDY